MLRNLCRDFKVPHGRTWSAWVIAYRSPVCHGSMAWAAKNATLRHPERAKQDSIFPRRSLSRSGAGQLRPPYERSQQGGAILGRLKTAPVTATTLTSPPIPLRLKRVIARNRRSVRPTETEQAAIRLQRDPRCGWDKSKPDRCPEPARPRVRESSAAWGQSSAPRSRSE